MKKHLWIGVISFVLGLLVAGFIFLSPEKQVIPETPIIALPSNSGHLIAGEKVPLRLKTL